MKKKLIWHLWGWGSSKWYIFKWIKTFLLQKFAAEVTDYRLPAFHKL